MYMKVNYYIILIVFLSLYPTDIYSQTRSIPKYHIGLEAGIGTTFPNFESSQERWRAGYYGAWSGAFTVMARFNKHWSGDMGIGLAGYAMMNRSDFDRYNLDFFSPFLITGLQYNLQVGEKREAFYGISLGVQQGYRDEFVESFQEYTVIASSKNKAYYFTRLQMGVRNELRQKSKRKPPMSMEFGTYFRYNFNELGKAEFIHPDNYIETLKPRGHVVGVFIKLLVPSSTTKVRIKSKQNIIPPTIYNPRMS